MKLVDCEFSAWQNVIDSCFEKKKAVEVEIAKKARHLLLRKTYPTKCDERTLVVASLYTVPFVN